jgi:hypothetical protein
MQLPIWPWLRPVLTYRVTLVQPVGADRPGRSVAGDSGARGGVTLSIADIDSRLLVCAEAGSGGRELARSSTTSALGWSLAVLEAKTDVLISISPFHVHDSLCACDRRGCGEAPASAGAGRRREAAGPGRRRSAAAR